MNEKIIRKSVLTIRLNTEEQSTLQAFVQQTTAQSLSEYARAVLLNKPVCILYRNASADSYLEEMLLLKKELNFIGHNFNQLVRKLHGLSTSPEIRTWALINERSKEELFQKIEHLFELVQQQYEQWSQK